MCEFSEASFIVDKQGRKVNKEIGTANCTEKRSNYFVLKHKNAAKEVVEAFIAEKMHQITQNEKLRQN